jgi:hypothetical protein
MRVPTNFIRDISIVPARNLSMVVSPSANQRHHGLSFGSCVMRSKRLASHPPPADQHAGKQVTAGWHPRNSKRAATQRPERKKKKKKSTDLFAAVMIVHRAPRTLTCVSGLGCCERFTHTCWPCARASPQMGSHRRICILIIGNVNE